MTLLSQIVIAGYYKKALMAICLCIALFAGSGSARGQGSGAGDQGSGVRYQMPDYEGQKSEVRDQRSGIVGQESEEGTKESGIRDQKLEVEDQGVFEERFEYFNDFIVYMKDDRKKDRILVCDVVVELNRGMKLPQERTELRKILYNTLKKPSDLHEIRRSLKEKIKIILNNFMGDEIIKNVYFSKFILL